MDGKKKDEKNYSTYGKSLWLYNLDGSGVYLLAHLSKFDNDIYIGKEYSPGEIVAYSGQSGENKDGAINEKTLNEYKQLIKTNKCNLSKVTWPRHADGS